ncbi:Aggrecan core protein, partial [Toxocara canis]
FVLVNSVVRLLIRTVSTETVILLRNSGRLKASISAVAKISLNSLPLYIIMLFAVFILFFMHTFPVNAGTCREGWALHTTWCYLVVPGQTTFDDAANFCGRLGSRLVWISTMLEQLFVNDLAKANGASKYWIGLNKIGGVWRWSNGSLPTFTSWRITQPDGCCGANVTCVLVNYIGESGVWDDAGCNYIWARPQGYVCKTAAT